MSPVVSLLGAVSLMLALDGLACFVVPRLLREEYARRAVADAAATRARGLKLLGAGTAGFWCWLWWSGALG